MRILIRRENPHPGAQLAIRAARGQALPGHRHEHARRADSVPGGPPQNPGQGRGQDPLREDHPAWDICHLPSARSIPPGARPRRSPVTCWPGCGSSPSTATWPKPSQRLCVTRSCIPPGGSSRPAPPAPENPAVLALGTRHRQRVRPHPRAAATLTSTSRPPNPKGPPAGRGTGAHPAREPGRYPTPGNENPRPKTHPAEPPGEHARPVNHRG